MGTVVIVLSIAVIALFVWLLINEIKNPSEKNDEEVENKPVAEHLDPPADEVPTDQPIEPEKPKEEDKPVEHNEVEQPAFDESQGTPQPEPKEEEPVLGSAKPETKYTSFQECIDAFKDYVTVPNDGITYNYLRELFLEAHQQTCLKSKNDLPILYTRGNFPDVFDYYGNQTDYAASFKSLIGWLFALQLAELKPKKRNQIFKAGYEFGGFTCDKPRFGYSFMSDPNVARLVASIIYATMRGRRKPDIATMRAEVGGTSYPYGLSHYLDIGLNSLKTVDDIQKNIVSKGGFYVDLRGVMPSAAGPYAEGYWDRPLWCTLSDKMDSWLNTKVDRTIHEFIVETFNLNAADADIRQMTVQAIADKEQSTNHLYGSNREVGGYQFHPVFGKDTIGKTIPTAGATANMTFSVQAIGTYFRIILQNKVDNPAYYGRLRPGCSWDVEKKKNSDTDDRRNVLVNITIEDNDGQKTSSYGYDDDGIWRATEVEAGQYAEHQKNHLGANSYPSGHSSGIWTVAMMLTEAMPDRADLIMRAANQFAVNRTITRYHWTSDTIYGRVIGSVANAMCHATADYDILLKAVKKELEK